MNIVIRRSSFSNMIRKMSSGTLNTGGELSLPVPSAEEDKDNKIDGKGDKFVNEVAAYKQRWAELKVKNKEKEEKLLKDKEKTLEALNNPFSKRKMTKKQSSNTLYPQPPAHTMESDDVLKSQSLSPSGKTRLPKIKESINKEAFPVSSGTPSMHDSSKRSLNMNHSKSDKEMLEENKNNFKVQRRLVDGRNPNSYAIKSLNFLPLTHPVRETLINIMENKWFDRIALFIILLNSLSLALTDYSVVDLNTNLPSGTGFSTSDLTQAAISPLNQVLDTLDSIFTICFTIECAIKILAMGFLQAPGAYLRDGWNWLDFTVVITGLLSSIPGLSKVSILRIFRVLRPLKSLHSVPKLRLLVVSIFNSLPGLANVCFVFVLMCIMFGIFGLQLWSGALNFRCRLVPEPIYLPPDLVDIYRESQFQFQFNNSQNIEGVNWYYNFLTNRTAFPYCGYPLDDSSWNQHTSLWIYAKDCAWPVDSNQGYIDNKGTVWGVDGDAYGNCAPDASVGRQCPNNEVCGSNFDLYGNARFSNPLIVQEGAYTSSMNYGFTNFDDLPQTIVTIFEVITTSGWSDVMMMMDNFAGSAFSDLYFMLFIFLGANLLMNLVFAVIWDNFDQPEDSATTSLGKEYEKELLSKKKSMLNVKENSFNTGVKAIKKLADHGFFQVIIILSILINSVVLALDEYPVDPLRNYRLEIINIILTLVFTFEMVVKMIGYGYRGYVQDNFNLFDAFIVTTSLIELGVDGLPSISQTGKSTGIISVLRAFRFFRLLKLARSWTSLQVLLTTIIKTVEDVSNFLLLFCLSIFILALIGTNIFGNKMHYDKFGVAVAMGSPGWEACKDRPFMFYGDCTWVPRNNFDSVGWGSLAIFQILTSDNWNNIWYDCIRAQGKIIAGMYMVFVQLIGNFIVFNLFQAILLGNFETTDSPEISEEMSMMKVLKKVKDISKIAPEPKVLPSTSLAPRRRSMASRRKSLSQEQQVQAVAQTVNLIARRRSTSGRSLDLGDSGRRRSISQDVSPSEVANDGNRISFNQNIEAMVLGAQPGGQSIAKVKSSTSGSVIAIGQNLDEITSNALANKNQGRTSFLISDVESLDKKSEAAKSFASTNPVNNSEQKQLKTVASAISVKSNVSYDQQEIEEKIKDEIRKRKLEKMMESTCGTCGKDKQHCICLKGVSMWFFTENNKIRVFCHSLVHNPYFDFFMIFVILISSVMLIFDCPLDSPELSNTLDTINNCCTVIFTLEMIIKVISIGFIEDEGSYIRSSWNILDFVLVVLAIITALLNDPKLQSLRTLRPFRALRPLRVISRNDGMKLIVKTLLNSLGAVFNVLILFFLVMFMFAIIATSLLKGATYNCVGMPTMPFTQTRASIFTLPQQYLITFPEYFDNLTADQQSWFSGNYSSNTSKDVCIWMGGTWKHVVYQNFDNFLQSMGAFFQMTTIEEWSFVNWQSIDSRGIDMQPIRDSSPTWALFFSFYMLFGVFFMKNVFIGAVCDSFNNIKDQLGGNVLLTDEQKEWIKSQKIIRAAKLKPKLRRPLNAFRGKTYDFVTSTYCDRFVMFCIVANFIVMAIGYFTMPFWFSDLLNILNYIFTGIFTLEAILKLISFGPRFYFRENWNCFDFCIVMGSNAGILSTFLNTSTQFGGSIGVIRLLRAVRILRLIKRAHGLNQLIDTMIGSIPAFLNIGMLFFLIIFIFAIIGMDLFSKNAYSPSYQYFNTHGNFRSFWVAFRTLYRWSTGENWDGFMYELDISTPDCIPDPPYNSSMCGFNGQEEGSGCIPLNGCGFGGGVTVYSYLYMFIVQYVLLNVFIAVVLEQFGDEAQDDLLSVNIIRGIAKAWLERDPDATYYLSFSEFSKLICELPPPLAFPGMTDKQKSKLLLSLDLPLLKHKDTGEDCVEFIQASLALGKLLVQMKAEARGATLEDIPHVILIKNNQRDLLSPGKIKNSNFLIEEAISPTNSTQKKTTAHLSATVVIQRAIRLRKWKKTAIFSMNKRKLSIQQENFRRKSLSQKSEKDAPENLKIETKNQIVLAKEEMEKGAIGTEENKNEENSVSKASGFTPTDMKKEDTITKDSETCVDSSKKFNTKPIKEEATLIYNKESSISVPSLVFDVNSLIKTVVERNTNNERK